MSGESTGMSEVPNEADLRERVIKHLDAGERLQAHTLIISEARRVKTEIGEDLFPITGETSFDAVRDRLEKCDQLLEPLLFVVVVGCFGGPKDMGSTWTGVIEFIGEYPQLHQQYVTNLRRLRAYPALVLAYGAGVAAVASKNYAVLAEVFTDTKTINFQTDEEQALPQSLYPGAIMDSQFAPGIFKDEPEPRDLNGHLRRVVRAALLDLVPSDRKFNESFDRFEALLALVHADLNRRAGRTNWQWVPLGQFHSRRGNQPSVWSILKAEADATGENWPVLKAGLLKASPDYFNEIKEGIDQFLARTRGW